MIFYSFSPINFIPFFPWHHITKTYSNIEYLSVKIQSKSKQNLLYKIERKKIFLSYVYYIGKAIYFICIYRKMNNTISKLFTFALISLSVIGLANAAIITVWPSETYTSLQAGITAAGNGGTVIVVDDLDGSDALWVIEQSLTIIGSGDVTLNANDAEGTLISIESSDVTISWLNITNINWYGISTKASDAGLQNIIITNNNISNIDHIGMIRPSGVGIYIWHMSGNFIYSGGTELLQDGLVAEMNYNGLIVNNNTMDNVADGISIQSVHGANTTELQITNNTITNTTTNRNGAGIWIDSSSYIDVTNNEVHNSYYGINITSYFVNKPWMVRSTTGSHHINIQDNIFTEQKSVDRYDGAGIAIYGSDVTTITISGNDLSDNAKYGILGAFTGTDILTGSYNYFGTGMTPADTLAKSYINATRVTKSTPSVIVIDPYYFTANHIRTSSSYISATGDNEITISYNMTELLSNTTWTNGTITIGTGTNTGGITSSTIIYNTDVFTWDFGYTWSNSFTGLDVGDYTYEINYLTSEGTGVVTTGTFEIALVAYGCWVDINATFYYPRIRFNTNKFNVSMTSPITWDLTAEWDGWADVTPFTKWSTTGHFEYNFNTGYSYDISDTSHTECP